jgi:hypothetical protein
MSGWQMLSVVAGFVLSAGLAPGQTYVLGEDLKAGDCFRVHMDMSLSGDMRVHRDGKLVPLKESASAVHEFSERVLLADKAGLVDKCARRYTTAKATITVGNDRSERSLNPDRGLFVAQRIKDQILIFNPSNPLTHEEIEVTEHFDTLVLTGLLPGKAVKIDETWKLPTAVVQAICHFEGLTEQDLKAKLVEVKDQRATFTVTGTASGIELGALVKLTVEATCRFDLNAKRLCWLEWKQKDEREQGPVSPASAVEVKTTVTRAVIDTPEPLADVALVSVPEGNAEPPAHMTQVNYVDPRSRFNLMHSREWTLVGQTEEYTILRLMDRGDFVTQATIKPWEPAEPGKHMDPEKFREMMARTPGWEMEKELQVGEVPSEGGRWIYRISALGQLEGSSVMQNFYLIAGPNGEQVVAVFTMTPKQADRLGSRDLSLAGSIDFPKKK